MDDRKCVKNSGDEIEDSPMDSDAPSSPLSETPEPRNKWELGTQLSRKNPLLTEMLAPDSNQPSPSSRKKNEAQLQQNLNVPLPLSVHESSVSDMSFSSIETSPPTNSTEFPTQRGPLLMEKIEVCQLDEPSSSKKNSEAQLQQNLNVPLPPGSHESSVSKESSSSETSRNPPEFPTQNGRLLMGKIEVCQPDEPSPSPKNSKEQILPDLSESLSPMMHAISISDEARKPPSVEDRTKPDVITGEESDSTLQPSSEDDSSAGVQSSSSSDALQSGNSSESVYGPIETRADRFPIYVSEAKILLQSVLREIMEFSEGDDRWRGLDLLFLDDSEFSKKRYESHLETDLFNYLKEMETDLSSIRHGNIVRDNAIENFLPAAHQMLTSVVVTALTFTLTMRLSVDFDGFRGLHACLRGLYDTFSSYWEIHNIEAVEDEAPRNNLKALKEKIRRLLLVTLIAFSLIALYIGENAVRT